MSEPAREAVVDRAQDPVGGGVAAGSCPARCCRVVGVPSSREVPSIIEVVVAPSGLEVYERAGEGAVDALEQKLRALGLRLSVRRRSLCG